MYTEEPLSLVENAPESRVDRLRAVIDRLDIIDAELVEPMALAEGALDGLDESKFERFSARVDEVAEDYANQPGRYDSQAIQYAALREFVDESTGQALGHYSELVQHHTEEAEPLSIMAEQLARTEYEQLRESVIATSDWHAVFAKRITDREYPGLERVIKALQFQHTSHKNNYRRTLGEIETLREWKTSLEENGDSLLPDERPEIPEGWSLNTRLARDAADWSAEVDTAAWDYLSTSRYEFVAANKPDDEVSALQSICYHLGMANGREAQRIPDELGYALEQQLPGIINRFYKKDAELLVAGRAEQPRALALTGLSLLRQATGLTDVPAWVEERMSAFPHELTDGLGFLSFMKNSDELKDAIGLKSSDGSLPILGAMDSDKNTLFLNVRLDGLASLDDVRDEASKAFLLEVSQDINRSRIEDRLDHEMMHHAHHQRLPISWLIQWNEIVRSEDATVSSYVDAMRSSRSPNHGSPNAEDLADSASQYLNDPLALLQRAPMRFMRLNDLFKRHSTDEIMRHQQAQLPADHDSVPA